MPAVGIPRDMQVAFLMAGHPRLGNDACGHWRQHQRAGSSCTDMLCLILHLLKQARGPHQTAPFCCAASHFGCTDSIGVAHAGTIAVGDLRPGESATVGHGKLVHPRALAVTPGRREAARILVADAGSNSIKVFDSADGASMCMTTEFRGEADSEWMNEWTGLICPVGLTVTSRGDLVVACGPQPDDTVRKQVEHKWQPSSGAEGLYGSLVLLDSSGHFVREIARRLPFRMPYTLGCDLFGQVMLMHRDGIAIYKLYGHPADEEGGRQAPIAAFDFPSRPEPTRQMEDEDGLRQDREHRVMLLRAELDRLKSSGAGEQVRVVEAELAAMQLDGPPVFTVSEASTILQLSAPCGVGTDPEGRFLLLDYQRDRVQLVARDGAVIASCPSGAPSHGQAATGFTEEDVRFADSILEPCHGVIDDAGKLAVISSDASAVVIYAQ